MPLRTYEREVAMGLRMLSDEQVRRIDLATLNLGHCLRCVVGQLVGEYNYRNLRELAGEPWLQNVQLMLWAVSRGFTVDGRDMSRAEVTNEYVLLTAEWKIQITHRLAGMPREAPAAAWTHREPPVVEKEADLVPA